VPADDNVLNLVRTVGKSTMADVGTELGELSVVGQLGTARAGS
jgi:hypothetical protein